MPDEEQSERPSEPQLNEMAATILTGLLASGDFTDSSTASGAGGKEVGSVRPEALSVAVGLAIQLEKTLKRMGQQQEEP
jgi:DNA gyrase/topoisomerase IV subunit B